VGEPDHDDDRVNAMVTALMARATYHETIREPADEAAAVVKAAQRPLPVLPTDPVQREAVLMVLLLQSRDRERRLLALLSGSAF
jgi:hypothetical protein